MDVENKAVDEGGYPQAERFVDQGTSRSELEDEGLVDECSDGALDTEPAGECSAPAEENDAAQGDGVGEFQPAPLSLMSVLMPANPPRPRNARIIRLFDLEAAKHDPKPEDADVPAIEPQPKEEPRTREALRAARNQSLLVAAGLR
ncbi:MAG: hypothetical protein ACXWUK_12935 [Burkholderiales bacterium]